MVEYVWWFVRCGCLGIAGSKPLSIFVGEAARLDQGHGNLKFMEIYLIIKESPRTFTEI
jgi:hypothetical protein